MKTHCRQWVCGHCDCLSISLIFRLTTFDVRIRRQKSSKSDNRVFYISLNKGYFAKAIFSRLFSARYHIWKKKKKKKKRYWAYVDVVLIITLSILATCLVSSNCSVTHVRWGEGTSSVLFQWRPAFSALWRRGNSVVSVHHINNFWNTRSNLTKFFRAVAATAANGVCKITCKTVENWLWYQRKTLHQLCHNVGSVFCINNFWCTQSNSVKFTGQLP